MLPYGRQSIDESDVAAVVAALRSDWLTTGPAVERFEQDLQAWTGARCVSVSSGTAALHTAYAALGVTTGDEVIVPAMTFVATASCASLLGAKVVFADVEPDTGNIDVDAVAAALSPRTRAVAAVDFAGQPVDYDALRAVINSSDVALLADAAHSIGATYGGRSVGTLADVTTFSFFPTKNLTTAEGGAVACLDDAVFERAREFRTIGLVRAKDRLRYPDEGPWHQEVHALGLNYRMPDVLAALGSSQLGRLAGFVETRRALFERYNACLADLDGVALPPLRPDRAPAWHFYPIRILGGRRREVFEKMRALGIGVQVNYVPVYWHPVYEDLGYQRGSCPNAEAYYAEELSLPLFPTLTTMQQDQVIDALRSALA